MTELVGKYVPTPDGTKYVWETKEVPTPTLDKRTKQLLFLLEAQLFHGLTRKEAVMLWNDGIDTLHSVVENIYFD
jgi:hypothetical protein